MQLVQVFLPQQALLSMSMLGSINAVARSTYADGVLRPQIFILSDQLPIILLAVCHTVAIILVHVFPWKAGQSLLER